MFYLLSELTKTTKQYAFFFFLPLFLKTKKKRDIISFSLEKLFLYLREKVTKRAKQTWAV